MTMFNLKKTVLITSFALFSSGFAGSVFSGDLHGELNEMFGNMSNYTQPGVFESTRRGVLAGGAFQARSRTMTIQLASFEPPNIKGGCGGIDIFLGSFSYINKDQLISFLRAIAANAAGYAFEMALTVSCPLCQQIINGMQKMAQEMNNLNMNSCQISQGIVRGDRAALESQLDFNSTLNNVIDGFSKDPTDDKSGPTQGREKAYDSNPTKFAQQYLGNIIWKAMVAKAVNDWFGLQPADTSMREVLMSISGTVIKEDPVQGEHGKVFPLKVYPGGLITMRDLIEGSKRNEQGTPDSETLIYSCRNDKNECKNPQRTRALNIKGLATEIEEALNKDGGIIFKFAHDDGTLTWTPQEKAIVSNFPAGIGSAIHNIAMGSETAAKTLSAPASKVIALGMVQSLMGELLKAIEASVSGLPEDQLVEVKQMIKAAKERLDIEYLQLLNEYGNYQSILENAATLQQFMEYESPLLSKNPFVTMAGSGATE